MLMLGMNELITVLYNPLWALLLVLIFLFAKTVYQELDIDAELQAGLLPGLLSISVKLWPTLTQVTPPSPQPPPTNMSPIPPHKTPQRVCWPCASFV